jgi:hypothetical protein
MGSNGKDIRINVGCDVRIKGMIFFNGNSINEKRGMKAGANVKKGN